MWKRRIPAVVVVILALALGACSNLNRQEQRALSGGALGAAGGALIGALAGSPAIGAAVGGAAGAAVGGLTDFVIVDRNRENQGNEVP